MCIDRFIRVFRYFAYLLRRSIIILISYHIRLLWPLWSIPSIRVVTVGISWNVWPLFLQYLTIGDDNNEFLSVAFFCNNNAVVTNTKTIINSIPMTLIIVSSCCGVNVLLSRWYRWPAWMVDDRNCCCWFCCLSIFLVYLRLIYYIIYYYATNPLFYEYIFKHLRI